MRIYTIECITSSQLYNSKAIVPDGMHFRQGYFILYILCYIRQGYYMW